MLPDPDKRPDNLKKNANRNKCKNISWPAFHAVPIQFTLWGYLPELLVKTVTNV